MQLGRYEILEPIGLGASSTVFKARDTLIGRIVAVKTLQSGLSDPTWRERFMAEARIVGQLSHPRIVKLHDMGIDETSGAPYLVMEFVVGETLDKHVASKKIEPQQVYGWGAALARALAYAHEQGIVHGDVKPANILINQDGRVMLTDFGIARFAAHISHPGGLRGTPAYLAPEQIEGNPTDGRSDLFSLGIVLYHLATGERPFRGESVEAVCAQILKAKITPPSRVNPALPRSFDDIIARCLARDPKDRYANGEVLSTALEAAARKPLPSGRQNSLTKRLVSSRLAYAAAAAVLAVAIVAPLAATFYRHNLRVPAGPMTMYPAPKPPADLPFWRDSQEASMPQDAAVAPVAAPPRPGAKPKPARTTEKPPRASEPERSSAQSAVEAEPATGTTGKAADQALASARLGRASMTIEISAQSSDGTLAVFADHELVFSTPLAAVAGSSGAGRTGAGEPFRTVCALAPGHHDLSVALYKADNSLRSQKQALAELQQGDSNLLTIRVVKHAKILLLRGPGLEVSWPTGSVSEQSSKDFSAKATQNDE